MFAARIIIAGALLATGLAVYAKPVAKPVASSESKSRTVVTRPAAKSAVRARPKAPARKSKSARGKKR
jgi:hypothetical protein